MCLMPTSAPRLEVSHSPNHTTARVHNCDCLGEHNIEAVAQQLAPPPHPSSGAAPPPPPPRVEGDARPQLRLDLRDLQYPTTAVLGPFTSLNHHLPSSGSPLVLPPPTPAVADALAVPRLASLFEI